ncbi:hypothetical protein HPB51_022258 [Rhipicephalus microplus]|uniref:FP protein C-terminal domain-containing protein n=1 Tax=Rhipicephalus microplus TaxID=6941 RepID=A0A9J6DPH9_RHIMP|nr:hypothetical protein HPB51_022258 [Rhipicephalus microplus]
MKDSTRKTQKCGGCRGETLIASGPLQAQLAEIGKKLSQISVLETNLDRLMGLQDTVRHIETSVQHLSDTYDELKDTLIRQEKDISDLRRQVETVEKSPEVTQITVLKRQVSELKQYSRRPNNEIHGITPRENESLFEEVNKIARCLEIPELSEDDIDGLHRLPTKEGKPPVAILRFASRAVRAKWFAKRKQLMNRLPGVKFFDNLTAANKQLLWMVKQKAREKDYRFVWTSEGRIFVRKQPDMRAISLNRG